jgi:hypothetical protein
LAWHLQSDADPVPDPAYQFEADSDPEFYLMRMRIQVTKMMRKKNTKIVGKECTKDMTDAYLNKYTRSHCKHPGVNLTIF